VGWHSWGGLRACFDFFASYPVESTHFEKNYLFSWPADEDCTLNHERAYEFKANKINHISIESLDSASLA
jgi:hypothetical protein